MFITYIIFAAERINIYVENWSFSKMKMNGSYYDYYFKTVKVVQKYIKPVSQTKE